MKGYTRLLATIGLVAAAGLGTGCSDDRETIRVRREEQQACEGRLTKLRDELRPRPSSPASTPESYAYPHMNEPKHPLVQKIVSFPITRGDYRFFLERYDNSAAIVTLRLRDRCSSPPARPRNPDAGIEECFVETGIEYARSDGSFAVYHRRIVRGGDEAERENSVRYTGKGQTLTWDTVDKIGRVDGLERIDRQIGELNLVPIDVAPTYRPAFEQLVQQITQRFQAEVDRRVAEAARLPTIE